MSLGAKRCSNLCYSTVVSSEGFTQKTTVSVVTENCLSGGVHLIRQLTRIFDLERREQVQKHHASLRLAFNTFPADFHGVEVYALGVDASGVSVAYWKDLRDFWFGYLRQSGALVKDRSILRSIPELIHKSE
jgi:hypothetical protein